MVDREARAGVLEMEGGRSRGGRRNGKSQNLAWGVDDRVCFDNGPGLEVKSKNSKAARRKRMRGEGWELWEGTGAYSA